MTLETAAFSGMRMPGTPVWRRADKRTVTDIDGVEYLDMAMLFGSVLFGHGSAWEDIQEILTRHGADSLPAGLGDLQTSSLRERAQSRLCAWASHYWGRTDLNAFICHSGSEAVETAIKTALRATGRSRIMAVTGGYHGTFGLAALATHRPEFSADIRALTGDGCVEHFSINTVPDFTDDVACIVIEPMQGRGGHFQWDDDVLSDVFSAARRAGVVVIVDSVYVGCGRTGEMLTGAALAPDILCLGKALGNGLPAAATITHRTLMRQAFDNAMDEPSHTATHYGSAVASAAILATLKNLGELEDEGLRDVCNPIHEIAYAIEELADGAYTVRGRGAAWVFDTKQPGMGVRVVRELLDEHQVIAIPCGADGSMIQVCPALTTSAAERDRFMRAMVSCAQTVVYA